MNKKTKYDKKRFIIYSLILIVGGGLLVAKLILPNLPERKLNSDNTSTTESTSFSQEPVSVDKRLLLAATDKFSKKSPPVRIIIPELNIDIPVREARVVNGYWEVFPDVAGFGLGSAYPDELGNQVIFAHARDGLFLKLKDAKIGKNIYVFTKDRWYFYKVTEIKDVWPSQIEVIAPTKDQTLTLFTCSGFLDSKRLIVTAKSV